ncbi:BON domain-containing protein [Paraburkholderia sp.]|uniref:BON domain-containing protein n=1 Tax=Paraburkholderia sp. TaxID=1926495 RepID=UPI003C779737
MKPWSVVVLLAVLGMLGRELRAQETDLKNWYSDPFFALSEGFADCQVPLGPFMTRTEMEDDAHYRVERGTTCWLAHKCTKPNSYMYDAPIAEAIHAHFPNPHAFDGTSVWITVQRRFVYAEGCAPASFDVHALQQQLEAIPDVEQVFMRVSTTAHGPLPYKTLAAPNASLADPTN